MAIVTGIPPRHKVILSALPTEQEGGGDNEAAALSATVTRLQDKHLEVGGLRLHANAIGQRRGVEAISGASSQEKAQRAYEQLVKPHLTVERTAVAVVNGAIQGCQIAAHGFKALMSHPAQSIAGVVVAVNDLALLSAYGDMVCDGHIHPLAEDAKERTVQRLLPLAALGGEIVEAPWEKKIELTTSVVTAAAVTGGVIKAGISSLGLRGPGLVGNVWEPLPVPVLARSHAPRGPSSEAPLFLSTGPSASRSTPQLRNREVVPLRLVEMTEENRSHVRDVVARWRTEALELIKMPGAPKELLGDASYVAKRMSSLLRNPTSTYRRVFLAMNKETIESIMIIKRTGRTAPLEVDYLASNPSTIFPVMPSAKPIKGGGTFLMRSAEEIARREGRSSIAVHSLEASESFYEKCGYRYPSILSYDPMYKPVRPVLVLEPPKFEPEMFQIALPLGWKSPPKVAEPAAAVPAVASRQRPFPKRGSMWWVDFSLDTVGREIQKLRPALVVSATRLNKNSEIIIVAPIVTSKSGKSFSSELTTTVYDREGTIKFNHLRGVDVSRFRGSVGTLSAETMEKVDAVIRDVLGLPF